MTPTIAAPLNVNRARRPSAIDVRFNETRLVLGAAARRTIDIVGAAFGLALLAPILLISALAVKLTSRGNVLYWQVRVGHLGRNFKMPKFRSMRVNADKQKTALAAASSGATTGGVRFKLKRDPRVTSVGRVLRRFSIDEMPQLWSVLTGEMTLIGPRPAIPREVELYEGLAHRRLEVKPGLTCLWQIGGRSDLSFEEQVQLDVCYIDQGTLMGDISILLKTVPAVLSGRGAY
jgi:lipopolysaccharide/colanic/teichoic acid biosynthesis glycosyltransferase